MPLRLPIIAGCLGLAAMAGGFAAWRTIRPAIDPPASIAILRFSAGSGTEIEEGLALSFAENLKTALVATGKVDVRDAQPASATDRTAVARGISADSFLTGSVRTTGTNVQSLVSLVRVSDGKLLWTGTFEGTVSNWFPVEDRAASELLSALWRELPVVQHHTADPEADQLYWRARFVMQGGTRDNVRTAAELFQKAAQKDPADALAWSGLADAALQLSGYATSPPHELTARVRAAARRAIELDPTIPEPHTSLGLVARNVDRDWQEAERDFKRALDLDPKDAAAHHWYGDILVLTGRIDSGLAELKSAEHLEPLSPLIGSDYAKCLYLARRYDEAIAKAKSALATAPNAAGPHQWLAAAYFQKKMYAESVQEAERLAAPATAFSIAVAAAGAGNANKAFEFLEKAFTDREPDLISLRMDPAFDPLRSDPRFDLMLARMHLR